MNAAVTSSINAATTGRRFVTLDVFTTRTLAGNPLAVVLDSEELDTAAMQAIAAEFNLSETVFVLPPAASGHHADLRIFTPGRELPFAGHPTIGSAVLLAMLGGLKPGDGFILGEVVGPVSCTVVTVGEGLGSASFQLPRLPVEVEPAATRSVIADALGLGVEQIGFDGHHPTVMSAGVGFTYVPVRGLEAIRSIKLDMARWNDAMRPADHANAFVYCRETDEAGHHYHARMFAPGMGIAEDPATGAAVAGFAGVVMAFDTPADGTHAMVIEQGYEMGRASQIGLTLHVAGGKLVQAFIGGSAVVVSEGVLKL